MKPLLDTSAGGYYNIDKQWIQISSGTVGYFTSTGEFKTSAGGYFESPKSEWTEGLKGGFYNQNGQWVPNANPDRSSVAYSATSYGPLDQEESKAFAELSDETPIAGTTWNNLRSSAMVPEHKEQGWYEDLNPADKGLLERLIVS